jgi:hypothetical protein
MIPQLVAWAQRQTRCSLCNRLTFPVIQDCSSRAAANSEWSCERRRVSRSCLRREHGKLAPACRRRCRTYLVTMRQASLVFYRSKSYTCVTSTPTATSGAAYSCRDIRCQASALAQGHHRDGPSDRRSTKHNVRDNNSSSLLGQLAADPCLLPTRALLVNDATLSMPK